MMRFGAVFLLSSIVSATVTGGAAAQQPPQLPPEEDARLALIDYCVLQESSKHGQYGTYVATCKCATSAVLKTMNARDMQAVAKWRKPTSAMKGRWEQAWQGCN